MTKVAIHSACIIACLLIPVSAAAATWYVDKANTSGTVDGNSWETAFTTIQAGIDAALSDEGGDVWVAEGRYDELRISLFDDGTSTVDTSSVQMQPGVRLFGGFSGSENMLEDRDWRTRLSIIDASTSAGNAQAAVHAVLMADDSLLDGFIVEGGSADGGLGGLNHGGALRFRGASGIVQNCVIRDCFAINSGGAAYVELGASPTILNSFFLGNVVGQVDKVSAGGGAISVVSESSVTIVNCVFSGNRAVVGLLGNGGEGGAIRAFGGSATIVNSVFH